VSEATRTIREICQGITLLNPKVVARLNREAELGTMAPAVFINLMDRGWGRPIPMGAEKPPNQGLYFINYRAGHDPLKAKTDAMLEAKAQEERLLALEEGWQDPEEILRGARTAADAKGKDDEVAEELEAVKPDMPDLSAVRDMLPPQRSQYERDRLPRGER
jgi:hypothetical protein